MHNISLSSTNISSDWTNSGAFGFLGPREKVTIIKNNDLEWEIQLIHQGNIFQRLAKAIVGIFKQDATTNSEVWFSKKFNPSLIVKAGILVENVDNLFRQTLNSHRPARNMYYTICEAVSGLPGENLPLNRMKVSPEVIKLSSTMTKNANNATTIYRQPTTLHPLFKLLNAKTDNEFVSIQRAIKQDYPTIFNSIADERDALSNNAQYPTELDKRKQAVNITFRKLFEKLTPEEKGEIYGEIYNRRPSSDQHTNDGQYGEHHVFDDIFKLLMIFQEKGHLGVTTREVKVWEGFEREDNNKSRTFTSGNTPLQKGAVGYINGKDVDFDQANAIAATLSDTYEIGQIQGVFNAPQKADARAVDQDDALSLFLYSNPQVLTPATRLILEQWNEFFRTHRASEKFLQICHGEGSLHVRNALEQLPEELRRRICILSVNPTYYFEPIEGTQIVQLYKADDEPKICFNKNIREYTPHCYRVRHTTGSNAHEFVAKDSNVEEDSKVVEYFKLKPYIEKFIADGVLY